MQPRQEKVYPELPDRRQTAWQLAAIQLAGWTSLPILGTSIYILQVNSFLGAVFTIVVGNAILWLIRLVILWMSYAKRQSTLDLARDYLGKVGGYFVAILLLITTLFWFIAQTTKGSSSITQLLPINEDPNIDQFTQVSVLLGLISTLFCMGGMVMLRKLSTWAFPVLIVAFFVILFGFTDLRLPENIHSFSVAGSLAGLPLVLATNLGITADLPTFFRHSRSWPTSVQALTLVQLVSLVLGIGSLYLGAITLGGFGIHHEAIQVSGSLFFRYFLIGFIFLSLVSANVANVYSASVGWELVAPKAFVGKKEYFILGLGLTTIFILVSGLFSLETYLNAADGSLEMLSIVLLFGYLISLRKKQLPRFFEQTTYFSAWFIATLINTLKVTHLLHAKYSHLLVGFIVILIVIGISFSGRFVWKKVAR